MLRERQRELDQEAGRVLMAVRKAAGLTTTQLGFKCHYSARHIMRLEAGEQPISHKARLVIEQVLGPLPLPGPQDDEGQEPDKSTAATA